MPWEMIVKYNVKNDKVIQNINIETLFYPEVQIGEFV